MTAQIAWEWLAVGVGLGWSVALPVGLLIRERLRRTCDELRIRLERLAEVEAELTQVRAERDDSVRQIAVLEEKLTQESRRVEEARALLEAAEQRLADTFKALSQDALAQSQRLFLQQAEQAFKRLQGEAEHELEKKHLAVEALVKPIDEHLQRLQAEISEIEKSRIGAYQALKAQLDDLLTTHLPRLYKETEHLNRALRQPAARGRWGEVQLKRVVEMAGMIAYCDFEEQVGGKEGDRALRPDLIVRLPNRRLVVVDAKVPLEAYLKAMEAEDDHTRKDYLKKHASHLRRHIQQLGQKSYFEQFDCAPEFVVLFIPGEAFFSAALHADPELIEYGVANKVIPASPTTLIALLKAVAYGWQQENIAQSAEEIRRLGKELYERIAKVAEHWRNMGSQLDRVVKSYNEATSSLETRLLPTARKFQTLKGEEKELALMKLTQRVYRLPDELS